LLTLPKKSALGKVTWRGKHLLLPQMTASLYLGHDGRVWLTPCPSPASNVRRKSLMAQQEGNNMSTQRYPRTRRGLLSVTGLMVALVAAALSLLSPRVAAAQAFPQSCAGTYLIRLSSGDQRLWP